MIATLGLLFKKDAPGHLNRLSLALLSGKLGNMLVTPKYLSAGKKNDSLVHRVQVIVVSYELKYNPAIS